MRKITLFKRACAVTMAAVLATTMVPTKFNLFGMTPVSTVKAAGLAYTGIDLTGGVTTTAIYGGTLNMSSLSDAEYSAGEKEIDGVTYPGYINFTSNAESSGVPTKYAYKLAPTKGGDVTLAFKVNKGKTFYFVDAEGKVIDSVTNGTDASAFYSKTYTLEAGKVYYAYVGGNKLFLYGANWAADMVKTTVDLKKGIVAAAGSDVVDEATGITYLDGFQTSTDGGFAELYKDGEKSITAVTVFNKHKTNEVFTSATSREFKALPTKGGIKFVPTEDGLIALDIKINKKSDTDDKPYFALDVDGNGAVAVMDYQSVAGSTYSKLTYNVKAGHTYYFGQANGSFVVHEIVITQGTKAPLTPWKDVATPVIKSVTVNDDGDFVVTVNAVVEQYAGAEVVTVTMLHNGGQAGETTIKSSSGEAKAVLTPYESGDYTFVAVAQRTGEADKISESQEYKDYILSVKAPVIVDAMNLGNGEVYIDYLNIPDADKGYEVSIKEKAAADDTYVTVASDKGNHTFTGLTVGTTYTAKVTALRSDDRKASSTIDFTVANEESHNWYAGTIGSAQEANITIDGTSIKQYTGDSGTKTSQKMLLTVDPTKSESIAMAGSNSGKISDDEEGFTYIYTYVDPNKKNFSMSATFEVTDNSLTPDNQTGFGVVVSDTVGMDNWGSADFTHKYFNQFASMFFSATKMTLPVMRTVTGYTSIDTSNKDGVERLVTNKTMNNVTSTGNWYAVGAKYTFTVNKTDNGYEAVAKNVATGATQTQTLDYNDITSVQDDGSVAVGFMVSRKISVKVTDVAYSTSASAGLKTQNATETKITPSVRIYSTNTVGTDTYELIAVPNCAGKLTVGSNEAMDVTANQVVRVNVAVKEGSNTITTKLVPTPAANLTTTAEQTTSTNVTYKKIEADRVYVAPNGKSTATGTKEDPMLLSEVVKYAHPGQEIVLMEGTYSVTSIPRSVAGTADKTIKLVAEKISTDGTSGVVFNGGGLTIEGSYWHVYGLYVKDASGVGIQICGNNNIVEMCTVRHSSNTGIQISRSGGADNEAGIKGRLWPSDNLIKNCESFDNCDAGRNDADGFAAKLTSGNGNKFYGCIGHNNIDDGWDLYAKGITGSIGKVVIENCVAYNNGWLTTDDISAASYQYGEGNGFKLGGGYLKGGHELINSVTFGNHSKGVTSNSCPDISITNVTAYNNGNASSYSIGLNTMDSMLKEWKVSGLISLTTADKTKNSDLIPFSLHKADNFIWNGTKSVNNSAVEATASWFKNVDTSVAPTRNADGTINMHDLLVLTAEAPANTGATLDVTSDAAKSVCPVKLSDDPKPTPMEGYLSKLYNTFLLRESDEAGQQYIMDKINNKEMTAIELVTAFVNSEEYTAKNDDNKTFITSLYTILNREAEEAGLNYWIEQMESGVTKDEIIGKFLKSEEFEAFCGELGIEVGDVPMPAPEKNDKAFVLRIYNIFLNRGAADSEVAFWLDQLHNQNLSGGEMARGFVFSQEFIASNVDDKTYVAYLYKGILGRDAEESGLAFWMSELSNGKTREDLFNGFATSDEWKGICQEYGINP